MPFSVIFQKYSSNQGFNCFEVWTLTCGLNYPHLIGVGSLDFLNGSSPPLSHKKLETPLSMLYLCKSKEWGRFFHPPQNSPSWDIFWRDIRRLVSRSCQNYTAETEENKCGGDCASRQLVVSQW